MSADVYFFVFLPFHSLLKMVIPIIDKGLKIKKVVKPKAKNNLNCWFERINLIKLLNLIKTY